MKKYILIILACFTFFSCSEKKELLVNEVCLTGSTINIDSSNVIKYPWIIMGEKVISMKIFGNRDWYISSLKNNELGKSEHLFNVGNGHNEFKYLKFAKGNNNTLFLFDAIFRPFSMTVIPNVKSIDDLKNSSKWKKYNLKDMEPIYTLGRNFYPMSDSTILMCATPDRFPGPGYLMSIIDYKNKTCQPLDFWPDDGIKIDSLIKCQVYAYESKIYGNGKGHYLYLCDRERYSFIFSIDGNKVNVVKDLYTTYSKYTTKNHIDPIKERVRTEGLACDTNDDYIYLLLTDTDRTGEKVDIDEFNRRPRYLYGNTIEIYDWNGKLLKRLKLDHSGRRIILSDEGKTLYLFTDDYFEGEVNPQIWSYTLSDLE